MASSVKSSISTIKSVLSSRIKGEKRIEPVLQFKNCDAPEELMEKIAELYKKHCNAPTLPKLCEEIKKDLDKSEPKGWVVFSGMHIAGVCSFISKTMVEFEANGVHFIIFKTFCPA